MRPIKFRAWHDNKMIYKIAVGESTASYNDKNFDEEIYLPLNTPVMQYTGIKDKNGKEIYEGDVFNSYVYNGISPKPMHVFKNNTVKWFDDFAGFGISPIDQHQLEEGYRVEYKVIGNIYENPDLIK